MKKILYTFFMMMIAAFATAQGTIDRSKAPTAGPAPVIKIADPAVFTLPNGITVLVVENHKLPKINASISIDRAAIVEGSKGGVMQIMGGMLNEGTKSMSKEKFDNEIDLMGADVNLNSEGGFVSALSRYFPKALEMAADAIINPAMKQENFEKLKTQAITGYKSSEKSASAISGRMVNALFFGKQTAMGEFETEETLRSITLNDVKQFYSANITPSRMYITFVGDITPANAKNLATKFFGTWKGPKLNYTIFPQVKNVAKTEINLIDVPNAVQSEITVGNLINNPLNNPDYHALLVANQILGGGSDGKLFMNLREKHGFTYGSYSNTGSGRQQALFKGSAQVRNEKADSAIAEILSEMNNMRNGNITDAELSLAKAKYNGSFALGMERPQTAAGYAMNILVNKLPKDFYRTFLTKLNAVTKADVQRVAKKYFTTANARIVVVGKADVLSPKLAGLGYPVQQYDKYATALPKAGATANVPATATSNISAQQVIDNYITAIGGKDALEKVKTISSGASMEISGQKLTGSLKKMAPNMSYMELKMGPMTVMKEVFDGKAGYAMQGPQKKDKDADEIKQTNADELGLFSQLFYSTPGFKLEKLANEKVNGEDCYKLKVTKPSGKVATEYYSTKTGLQVKEDKTEEIQGQQMNIEFYYSDYQKVNGVLLPAKLVQAVMGQEFAIVLSDLKINEGVSAEDFK